MSKRLYYRDDYMVGFDIHVSLRKPGAMHPARRMAKAIYSMKIELLFRGNETVVTVVDSS